MCVNNDNGDKRSQKTGDTGAYILILLMDVDGISRTFAIQRRTNRINSVVQIFFDSRATDPPIDVPSPSSPRSNCFHDFYHFFLSFETPPREFELLSSYFLVDSNLSPRRKECRAGVPSKGEARVAERGERKKRIAGTSITKSVAPVL